MGWPLQPCHRCRRRGRRHEPDWRCSVWMHSSHSAWMTNASLSSRRSRTFLGLRIKKRYLRVKGAGKGSVFLDIYHPVRRFYERNIEGRDMPSGQLHSVLRWNSDDTCAAAFEAMVGDYPPMTETGMDYREFAQLNTAGSAPPMLVDKPIDGSIVRSVTPSVLTTLGLRSEFVAASYSPGIFVGTPADSFAHLVEFWNLRAANIDVFFYDLRASRTF